jgi:hypothetical protein
LAPIFDVSRTSARTLSLTSSSWERELLGRLSWIAEKKREEEEEEEEEEDVEEEEKEEEEKEEEEKEEG